MASCAPTKGPSFPYLHPPLTTSVTSLRPRRRNMLLLSSLVVVGLRIDGSLATFVVAPVSSTTAVSRRCQQRSTMRHGPLRMVSEPNTDPIVASLTSSSTMNTALSEEGVFPIPTAEAASKMDALVSSSSSSPSMVNDKAKSLEYRRGLFTVAFITLLFSSNSPVLHAAFTTSQSVSSDIMVDATTTIGFGSVGAPPVLLLNAAISVVALVGLALGGDSLEWLETQHRASPSSLDRQHKQPDTTAWRAGVELGLYKFLGTTANIWGLSLTTASHGALLIQLTTLTVPVAQGLQGVPIPRKIQLSVALALAGVICFTQDTTTTTAVGADAAAWTTTMTWRGDGLCVLAAIFYSMYDLRLFAWGKQVPAKAMITRKIATQAVLSVVVLVALSGTESWDYIQRVILEVTPSQNGVQRTTASTANLLLVHSVVLWSGVAVNAVAPYLQVGGQQVVGPTRCQTIYASQPLWAALLSYAFLGETIGPPGMVGGSIFLAALFLAATAEAPDPNCGQDNCEV